MPSFFRRQMVPDGCAGWMEDEARAFPPLLRKDVAPWLKSCEEKQLQVPRLPLVARNDNLLRIESGFESC